MATVSFQTSLLNVKMRGGRLFFRFPFAIKIESPLRFFITNWLRSRVVPTLEHLGRYYTSDATPHSEDYKIFAQYDTPFHPYRTSIGSIIGLPGPKIRTGRLHRSIRAFYRHVGRGLAGSVFEVTLGAGMFYSRFLEGGRRPFRRYRYYPHISSAIGEFYYVHAPRFIDEFMSKYFGLRSNGQISNPHAWVNIFEITRFVR